MSQKLEVVKSRADERDIEARLTRQVEKLGGQCVKFGQNGWPDRIVLVGGKVWFAELKSSSGKLSPLQVYRGEWLVSHGYRAVVLRSKSDVDEFVNQIKRAE